MPMSYFRKGHQLPHLANFCTLQAAQKVRIGHQLPRLANFCTSQAAQKEMTEIETGGSVTVSDESFIARLAKFCTWQAAQKETTESETGGSVTVSDQLFIAMLDATCVNLGLVSESGEPVKPARACSPIPRRLISSRRRGAHRVGAFHRLCTVEQCLHGRLTLHSTWIQGKKSEPQYDSMLWMSSNKCAPTKVV